MALTLTSPAFTTGQDIPSLYTSDGRNISPLLQWSGLPEGTKSLALIVQDPDAPDPQAPRMTFTHWVLYNLPPTAQELPEGVTSEKLPHGTREGQNNANKPGYTGPKPPLGKHRYFFKLFALDRELPDLGQATREELEQAMNGHILAQAELIGLYQKAR